MSSVDTDTLARRARQEFLQRRRELETELNRLNAIIAALDNGVATQTGSATLPKATAIKNAKTKARPRGRRSTIAPRALGVLKANGGTMHADEIVRALQEQGVKLSAKDPKATVVTVLRRLAERTGEVEVLGGNRYRARRGDVAEGWVGTRETSEGPPPSMSFATPANP